jgi:uncharacterized protein (DUF1778 family)
MLKTRTGNIRIRLREDEKAVLVEAARRADLTLSDWAREQLMRAAAQHPHHKASHPKLFWGLGQGQR